MSTLRSGVQRMPTFLALGLVVAACAAPATSETSSPSEAAVASEVSEPSPTASREHEAPPSLPACDPESVCDGPIAGEFTSTSTGAMITMTIPDDGWVGQRDIPGVGFGVFREDLGDYTGISITSFSGEVFAEACDPNAGTAQIDTAPEAFIAWLSEREGITAGEPIETTVGGQPAVSVDVTSELPEACTEPPWIFLWTLPEVGDFHLNDQETARIYAVEAADATVLIVVEAFPGADWEAFLPQAEAIIQAMEIDAGV
jgi:hypothetical protein